MGEMSRLEQITFVANAFGCCSCVCEETFDLGDYCSRDVFRGVKESCVYIYIYLLDEIKDDNVIAKRRFWIIYGL